MDLFLLLGKINDINTKRDQKHFLKSLLKGICKKNRKLIQRLLLLLKRIQWIIQMQSILIQQSPDFLMFVPMLDANRIRENMSFSNGIFPLLRFIPVATTISIFGKCTKDFIKWIKQKFIEIKGYADCHKLYIVYFELVVAKENARSNKKDLTVRKKVSGSPLVKLWRHSCPPIFRKPPHFSRFF